METNRAFVISSRILKSSLFFLLLVGCSSSSGSGGNAGGATVTVGTSAIGGGSAKGGNSGIGGTTITVGTSATGGASANGGNSSIGGTSVTVGTSATDGGSAKGGNSGIGGTTVTVGTSATGGGSANGGNSGIGGTTVAVGTSATGGATISLGGASSNVPASGGAGGKSTGSSQGGTQANATGGASGGRDNTTGGTAGSNPGVGGTAPCPVVADFDSLTGSKGPLEVGKLAVKDFMPRADEPYGGDGYAWTFGFVGSLQFTKTIGDSQNNAQLIAGFDCGQQGPDNGTNADVDERAFGVLPLEIFLQNGSSACKALGLSRADAQWKNTTDDGITRDARYWIDDMYMITSLQVWAYRATMKDKDPPDYLGRAAKTMVAYIAALQKNNTESTATGLFWHTKDTRAYWGRANGWVASGMTELLLELPADHPNRADILAAYKRQMEGLLPLQISGGNDDGCWRQVLDRTDAGSETSCTAMFTFALVTGVKNGWLTDQKFVSAARKGWVALANKTDSNGTLSRVCPGTGQANQDGVRPTLKAQQDFYIELEKSFAPGDRHGQGPELWAANALLRKDCPGGAVSP